MNWTQMTVAQIVVMIAVPAVLMFIAGWMTGRLTRKEKKLPVTNAAEPVSIEIPMQSTELGEIEWKPVMVDGVEWFQPVRR